MGAHAIPSPDDRNHAQNPIPVLPLAIHLGGCRSSRDMGKSDAGMACQPRHPPGRQHRGGGIGFEKPLAARPQARSAEGVGAAG